MGNIIENIPVIKIPAKIPRGEMPCGLKMPSIKFAPNKTKKRFKSDFLFGERIDPKNKKL